ncbi:MAG: hypothetical protein HKN68_04690 [Saprospiraceae bacterium]|nr:hypothetical protein [Saprospiraceae bacterium]
MKCVISAICATIIFGSCNFNKLEFELINRSGTTIYDIEITTSSGASSLHLDSIPMKVSEQVYLNLFGEPSVDGSYTITYLLNSYSYNYDFGYYTNGSPITEKYILQIEQDTIRIQEILRGDY